MNLRFIKIKDVIYFRAEDVASYIRELASTEETDVRKRLNLAALKLQNQRINDND